MIGFGWKNFLNFSEKENGGAIVFTMVAGENSLHPSHAVKVKENLELLKFSALFGANASGKSNFVRAIQFFQQFVINGGFPPGATQWWCRTDEKNKKKASQFEIRFIKDGVVYSYGVTLVLSELKIVSEWLYELNAESVEKVVFERNLEENSFHFLGDGSNGDASNDRVRIYFEDFGANQEKLFLSHINHLGLNFEHRSSAWTYLQAAYQWITQSIVIITPHTPMTAPSLFDAGNVDPKMICDCLQSFGIGITGYEIAEMDGGDFMQQMPPAIKERILREIDRYVSTPVEQRGDGKPKWLVSFFDRIYQVEIQDEKTIKVGELRFIHDSAFGRTGFPFHLDEESDGTLRLLGLLEVFLNRKKSVFIIDDLDRSLHPNLTEEFVSEFLDFVGESENSNRQMIVTTHASGLLDLYRLRRDEVWFVEKRDNGEADLYSLDEFEENPEKKIEGAYKLGRFGGVPSFTMPFPV